MATVSGLATTLETVTVRVAVAVRPVESFTVAVSVWLPLAAVVVFDAPWAPLSHSTAQLVPLTVAPPAGCVRKTCSVPDGGGGGGGVVVVLLTVSVRVAVPLKPAESVTVPVSVCAALVTVVVFQL